MSFKYFELIEKKTWLLGVMTAVFVSFGGLAEITPLFAAANKIEAADIKPYDPLRLAGFQTYVHNGCYLCHSQMIRNLGFETQRYGSVSLAQESFYDRPMQWGSKRTGPDLARIGGKYSDAWHLEHMRDPRSVVPQSNMPKYDWLENLTIDAELIQSRMRAMRMLGNPYTDEDIANAPSKLEGKTQMDAIIAYLQGLGIDNRPQNAGEHDKVHKL
ncbi:MAG: cytochrome-c oxidase, cbb3-type subunit II [Venatoribacter sp.]